MSQTDIDTSETEAERAPDFRSILATLRSIDAKTPDNDSTLHVYVRDFDIPFGQMVVLVIKFWFATAVAAVLIFSLLGLILSAFVRGPVLDFLRFR